MARSSGEPVEAIADLRKTLDWLRSEGDLVETKVEVDPDLEILGLQKHMDGGCPALFHNVKGKPNHRVVTNLFGDMNVINKMFGWADDRNRTMKLAEALRNPIPPVVIDPTDAPCREEIFESPSDAEEFVVSIRHTETEPELTLGSGIRVVTGEAFDGGSDLGYNRMNLRWGNVATFQMAPGSHMWQVVGQHQREDKPVPITICFGVPPACTLLAGAGFDYVILPQGCDEIGVAGAVQGSPIRLVKAGTVDAMAIADSEVVLEGNVMPRDRRYETGEAEDADVQGRYNLHPEYSGYMGKAFKGPTFHITAVTTRRRESKPIIYSLGAHMLDEHNIDTTVREAAMYELCERMQPGIIQDVVIPYCMTDWGGAIIQVKKRNKLDEGWQRNFMSAILATSLGLRICIAVSEDTDPYDMDDVMWCLTTRVSPHSDIINPLPGGRGQTYQLGKTMNRSAMDRASSKTDFEGGMGIDATVPYGYESDFKRPVYPVDKVNPKDFFTDADLANVASRMKGWVHSLARTGR